MRVRVAALLLSIAMASPLEAGVRVTARYGGTTFTRPAAMNSSNLKGAVGGTQFLRAEIEGPVLAWGLRPFLGYGHHWTAEGEFPLALRSNVASVGVGRPFRLSYAFVVLKAAVAHFGDSYSLDVRGNTEDVVDNGWGATAGVDLRLRFLERIDAVVGYELIGRDVPRGSGSINEVVPYTLEGRSVEHCISAGFSVVLGGT